MTVTAKRRRPAFKLSAPVIREPVLHKQIADVLRLELAPAGRVSADGVVWWSVDMAGYVGVAPGLRTARGCVAGVPDIEIVYRGAAYFIELKAADGSLSPAQQGFAHALLLADSRFAVARSPDEVLALLDSWEIPRRHRIRSTAAGMSRRGIKELA